MTDDRRLQVNAGELRAVSTRWWAFATHLGEGAAPAVGASMTWPTVAAVHAIHTGTQAAIGTVAARVKQTAGGVNDAAAAYQSQDLSSSNMLSAVASTINSVSNPAAQTAGA